MFDHAKKYRPSERAGKLNQRVQIHFPVQTVNGYGERVEAWQALGYRWAAVEYGSKNEGDEAGQVTVMTAVNFTIRNAAEVNETMRVYYNNRLYNIQGVHISNDRLYAKLLTEQYDTGILTTPDGQGAIGQLAYIEHFSGINADRVTVTVFGGQLPQNKAQVFVTMNGQMIDQYNISGSDIIFDGFSITDYDNITVRFFI
jgi:SPP1 family predicted phage head-tail adaptor